MRVTIRAGRRSGLLAVRANVFCARTSELLLRGVRDMECALFMFFGIVPAVHIRS